MFSSCLFPSNAGERYDFVLNADEVPGCYWIRLIGLSDCYFAKANGVAILHYEDVSLEKPAGDPSLQREGVVRTHA